MTDGYGRTVDFKNTVIIMTSNAGVELIRRESALGFATRKDEAKVRKQGYEDMKEKDAARSWLAKAGFDPVYGARPLRRAIERYVENPLSAKILAGEFKDGDVIVVDLEGDTLTFAAKTLEPAGRKKK